MSHIVSKMRWWVIFKSYPKAAFFKKFSKTIVCDQFWNLKPVDYDTKFFFSKTKSKNVLTSSIYVSNARIRENHHKNTYKCPYIQPAVWNIEKLESLSWKVGIEIGKNISTKTLSKTSLPNEIRAFQRKTFQLLVISNWDKL